MVLDINLLITDISIVGISMSSAAFLTSQILVGTNQAIVERSQTKADINPAVLGINPLAADRSQAEADTSPAQIGINLFLVSTYQVAVVFNRARAATPWVKMAIIVMKVVTRLIPIFQQLLNHSATNSFKAKS